VNRVGLVVAALALSSCTDPALVGSSERHVIGGELATEGAYPATGGLFAGGQVMCTGTLISPTAVLTAGHCVDPLFVGGQVPGFTLDIDGNAPGAAVTPGKMTIQHPDFDMLAQPEPGLQVWNDVGVLVLAEPIVGVAYEHLPSAQEAEALTPDMALDIVGYGMTDVDETSFGVKTLGQATLVEVGTHELWIGSPGEQQNCNGDSGGPAFAGIEDGRLLVGIVSRSPDSNPVCDHGAIDTRVDAYMDWIKSVVPEFCEGPACTPGAEEPAPEPTEPVDDGEPPADASPGGCRLGGGQKGGLWLVCAAAFLLRRRRKRCDAV